MSGRNMEDLIDDYVDNWYEKQEIKSEFLKKTWFFYVLFFVTLGLIVFGVNVKSFTVENKMTNEDSFTKEVSYVVVGHVYNQDTEKYYVNEKQYNKVEIGKDYTVIIGNSNHDNVIKRIF